jgi:hypothetical protein
MKRVEWTKFQDFYLRLGFLKVLAAVLSAQRRSVPNDAIIRRLDSPLFDPAPMHRDLWGTVEELLPLPPPTPISARPKKKKLPPSVAEALLVRGECPSVLFAITGPTSYKILDWGRDVEFIGRGNQITERGLLLRYLLDERATNTFLTGNVTTWNPFLLSLKEKLFLLYHLSEIDGVIVELLDQLGDHELDEGAALESMGAARMTSRALLRVLKRMQGKVPPAEVLRFRTACALAVTIAEELEMLDEAGDLVGSARRKLPKAIKPRARRMLATGDGRGKARRTTKNADHQTIPRFEQLVDLGFLMKPVTPDATETEKLAARRRWHYIPTDICRRWAVARRELAQRDTPFLWYSFAAASIKAFQIAPSGNATPGRSQLVAGYVWNAYEQIHRRAGATPLDSVALFAMISAASEGVVLEMSEIHAFMLFIRRHSLLPDHAFFSSGNELDQMFIQLKLGFTEQVERFHQAFAEAGLG